MAYDNLLFEVSEQIARITFNRPNVLNALNRKTMDELGDCLKKVRADDAIRVVILTGAGEKAFIAGADINELSQQTPVNGPRIYFVRAGNYSPAGDAGETSDRRNQWFCARRRMRAGAGVHAAHR